MVNRNCRNWNRGWGGECYCIKVFLLTFWKIKICTWLQKFKIVKKNIQWKISLPPVSRSCPPFFPPEDAINSFLRIIPMIMYPYESMLLSITPPQKHEHFLSTVVAAGFTLYHYNWHNILAALPRPYIQVCFLLPSGCVVFHCTRLAVFFNQSQSSEHIGWFLCFAVLLSVPQWMFLCGYCSMPVSSTLRWNKSILYMGRLGYISLA